MGEGLHNRANSIERSKSRAMRLKIGDFSRVGTVSVSALRYYDEVGLLKPVEIDRWTGYRYYNIDQLPMLNRILALKDLGLSLEQIRSLMCDELPAEQIRGMLRLKQLDLQEQARELNERLQRVESRLQQIEMEGKMPEYDVVVKTVGPIRAAVLHDVIPNMDVVSQTFNRLFDEAYSYVYQNGGVTTEAGMDLWLDEPSDKPEDLRVMVAVPLKNRIPESSRIRIEELPGVEQMASVIHRGSFANLGQGYGALIGWINSNGYRICGPCREIYLEYARSSDPDQWVTELQIPVEKVS